MRMLFFLCTLVLLMSNFRWIVYLINPHVVIDKFIIWKRESTKKKKKIVFEAKVRDKQLN